MLFGNQGIAHAGKVLRIHITQVGMTLERLSPWVLNAGDT
jgi:hypothetical protein